MRSLVLPTPCVIRVVVLMRLLPLLAGAATYEVGPGKPLATPNEVPWESLQAGDTVLIHWRTNAYLSKWVLGRQGTTNAPIVIRGVPGPNGELPVIDGNGATTRSALNYWNQERGVIKIGGANVPPDTTPRHLVVENLDIRSARPPFTYTAASGSSAAYPNNAASIYVEKGEFITIRNCVLHDCGNGLFVSFESRDVLIESNYIYDNGNPASIYEHNSYTAAVGITFQFNRYGPLRTGCLGNNLKDRSAGLVVRYNWIEGGNRQLDLVDGEDSPTIRTNPLYRATRVYGNVLIEPEGAGNRQIVHYGGDSGNPAIYRKGTLYFYHNTIVSTRTDRTTLLRLSTNEEQCDCRNNVIYVSAAGSTLSLLDDTGVVNLTHNWLKPGWVNSFSAYTGTITNDGSNLTGSSPGFLAVATQNFQLGATSACLNAGAELHPAVLPAHEPVMEYRKQRVGERRRTRPPLDLGAFEFSPYHAWRHDRFGTDVDNPALAGDGADPDGDGIPNLAEYAFGLDPWVTSRAGLPWPVRSSAAGGGHLAVAFNRRPPVSELAYRVQASSDLRQWEDGSYYDDLVTIPSNTVTAEVSGGFPTVVRLNDLIPASPHKFLRVQVTRP